MGIFVSRARDENALEIDFGAMDFSTPRLTLSSSIGNGMDFISKCMSSKLSGSSGNAKPLLDYLLALDYQGEVSNFYKKFSERLITLSK